jgi:pyruvate/2-oxoglutarate dehydrogenase complex dihydrolipoamide acyltransferase (E2) component
VSEEPTRGVTDDSTEGATPAGAVLTSLTADPMVLASGVLVALGVLLLLVGVTGSWHWRAAVWCAVLASAAAFALVAVAATRRQGEFADRADFDDAADEWPVDEPAPRPARTAPARPSAAAPTAASVKDEAEAEPVPPRPRFAGFGKPKAAPAPPAPPPPQPSNVQVMHVQGGHVRVTPTPQPMPISQPERPAARPPSSPPATPPTIQVGAPRDPGFRTYQPVDPGAPVIQVRNRYHRPDCRYVTVADDAVQTTLGEARASNAMPCGVCRP